jgi:hypothetical protein
MKEKILAQLIAKYPGVSKKFLGLLAEKQSTKVTDETQIEGVINELDNLPISVTDLAAEWQKEGDARVIAAKKEWLVNPPKPDKPPKTDPPPTDPPKPDDEPAWFKAYREANDAKLNGLLQEKQQQSLQQKLKSHEKLKDIPEKFWSKRQLPKDEEIDAFADEVATDYSEIVPQQTQGSFIPGVGKRQKTDAKPSDKEIEGIVNNIMK